MTSPRQPGRRLRVALAINTIEAVGGAERVTALLSEIFEQLGHDVLVITFYEPLMAEHEPAGKRIRIGESRRGPKAGKLLTRAARIARACRRNRIDVLVAVDEPVNFPAVLSRGFGNPARVLLTVHADPNHLSVAFQRLVRLLYPRAHMVVAVSHALARVLREQYGVADVHVAHNPLDVAAFPAAPARRRTARAARGRGRGRRPPPCGHADRAVARASGRRLTGGSGQHARSAAPAPGCRSPDSAPPGS